jgi:hypothetical protein
MLVFSMFMSTLDDVIKEAKASGEFEGTAEDIKATKIEVGDEEELAIDPTSGKPTLLTTLFLDRGVSFDSACSMAFEEAKKITVEEEQPIKVSEEPINSENQDDEDAANDDSFIVDDDDDEVEDVWLSSSKKSKRGRAEAGFYISKGKIAGRYLVLFAKGKFVYKDFNSLEEANSFDPLGLMQVTRPNTGININDMSSAELRRKYRLACSCESLATAMADGDGADLTPVEIVSKASNRAAQLWNDTFDGSNNFEHKNGYAPRRMKVALANGPVLHIMSALEKAVRFHSEKDKALKIMRAQIGTRRVVGIRFPLDEIAHQALKQELENIQKARRDTGNAYTDEDMTPICPKSQKWATEERKTMKSFFQVISSAGGNLTAAKKADDGGNSSAPTSNKRTNSNKAAGASAAPTASRKKPKTMMSYFSKK